MKKLLLNACKTAVLLMLCASVQSTLAQCQIDTSQSQVDYGLLNQQMVAGTPGEISPGSRQVLVNIHCADAQFIQVRFSAPESDGNQFLFGQQGDVSLRISSPQLDGVSRALRYLPAHGAESTEPVTLLSPGPDSIIVTTKAGRHLAFTLSLLPHFHHYFSSVSDETMLDTHLSLEVNGDFLAAEAG